MRAAATPQTQVARTSAAPLTAPTNVVILGFRAPVAEVAYFTNANRLIAPLRGLVGPVVSAVYPHVSQKAARSEAEALRFVRKYRWWFAAPSRSYHVR